MNTNFAIFLLTALRGGGSIPAPSAPTGLSATVISTSRIDLAWTDAATNETEYRVYRSTDNVTFTLLDTIAAGSESYSDTSITSGTTYYYKVAAYNSGGEALSSAVSANTLTLSLVSYWQLEEASGTRVDAYGDNDLTPTNTPANAAGIVGNAAAFVSASSQQLVCANNATLQSGNIDHTIAAWVYPTAQSSSACIVCKTDVDAAANAAGYEWMLYQVSLTKVRFLVGKGGNGTGATNSFSVTSDVDLTINAWNYVEGFWDAANVLVGVVVNGTVKTASSTTVPGTSTGSLRIGAIGPGSSYFGGRVDEVGFWKRLHTSDERTAQYNGGAGRAPSFLA